MSLTNRMILDALDKGIIEVRRNQAIPGEVQYVLRLHNHPVMAFCDDKEVFIGSVPGGEDTYRFVNEYGNIESSE